MNRNINTTIFGSENSGKSQLLYVLSKERKEKNKDIYNFARYRLLV